MCTNVSWVTTCVVTRILLEEAATMNSWKLACASPETPISKAIEKIDAGAMQIAVVVDGEGRLLGTVTDGDVRRGILKGISIGEPVQKIMNPDPVTASANETNERLLTILRQKQIRQIPLVDRRGRVVGIHVLDELLGEFKRENWVVLMAGGAGARLRPLTDERPKPLIPVGQKPILETILENFVDYGFCRFFFSVNYKNEMVIDHFGDGSRWDVEIRYLKESQRLGTAGALSLLPSRPKEAVIVMNGDLLTNVNLDHLLNFHAENKADATMGVREYDFQVPYGVVKTDRHRVRGIDEKPIHRFFVNAGIYVLEPKTLQQVPKKAIFDMTQLFEKLVKQGQEVAAFPIREYWLDIGHLDDLKRANGEFPYVFR